jgi:hypothetical protein
MLILLETEPVRLASREVEMGLSKFVAIGLLGFAVLANVETSFGAQVKPVQGMAGKSPLGKSCTATSGGKDHQGNDSRRGW